VLKPPFSCATSNSAMKTTDGGGAACLPQARVLDTFSCMLSGTLWLNLKSKGNKR
jgi:hypothetical protein